MKVSITVSLVWGLVAIAAPPPGTESMGEKKVFSEDKLFQAVVGTSRELPLLDRLDQKIQKLEEKQKALETEGEKLVEAPPKVDPVEEAAVEARYEEIYRSIKTAKADIQVLKNYRNTLSGKIASVRRDLEDRLQQVAHLRDTEDLKSVAKEFQKFGEKYQVLKGALDRLTGKDVESIEPFENLSNLRWSLADLDKQVRAFFGEKRIYLSALPSEWQTVIPSVRNVRFEFKRSVVPESVLRGAYANPDRHGTSIR